MLGLTPASPAKPNGASDGIIKDGTDASFMADVIEASKVQPVIVDFWATWCGPCKTLTPAIEKAVIAAKGAVKLVKIDVDKNPAYAGQLRVQSIPTVYAFVNGQPVDRFQGAVADSQLRAFIDKLTGGESANSDIEQLMSLGEESLSLNDLGGAAQAFAQVLTLEPAHEGAIAGMARVYLADGDVDQARQTIAMAPADSKDAGVQSVRAQLTLEGLTSLDRKQPLPFLPNVIGLITGKDSDAEKDVLQNARLRWPEVKFRTIHTLVQGDKAAPEVIAAIQTLDADPEVDVIIIARGGGSFLDLMVFSDENLVRTAANAKTPIVSAIGHENDRPVLDDVEVPEPVEL